MFHIKQNLGDCLEKYFPRLYCLQHVIHHSGDADYAQRVLAAEMIGNEPLHWKDPRCMYVEHQGKRNPDKIVYLFEEQDYSGGFCTLYHRLLLALTYAESFGMVPVIFWDDAKLHYFGNDNQPGRNALERFFEPMSSLTAPQALVSRNLVLGMPVHLCMNMAKPFERYNTSGAELDICVSVQRKYVRIRADIIQTIDRERETLLQEGKVLGVHLDGAVLKWGLKGYPVMPSVSECQTAVEKTMLEGGYEKIFVSTDDHNVVEMMRELFGEKVLAYEDCCRTKGTMPVYLCDSQRQDHCARLGYEALRDIITLSKCEGLVTDLAQSGFLARVIKQARGEMFQHLCVMDKGYHKESTPLAEGQILRLLNYGKLAWL